MATVESIVDCLLQGQLDTAVDEIHEVLTNPEEVNGIREFSVLIQEAARQEEVQRSHVKEILKAYLSTKEDVETALAQDKSADKIGEEIAQLHAKHEEALKASDVINLQCQALKDERVKMEEKQKELSQMRETVKEDTTQVLPKTRYNVSLYSCVTGIKWDFDCKPDEIKGYVSTSRDVRPFSLDSKQHSRFFTTNYLWDLVEAAAEAK